MTTQRIVEYLSAQGAGDAEAIRRSIGAQETEFVSAVQELLGKGWITISDNRINLDARADILSAHGVTTRCRTRHFALSPTVYPLLASTNTELYRRAQEGAPEGTWIAAGAQSAGIGRMGRSFFSPGDTGLYMSLLLRPEQTTDIALRLTTASAVAVCETLRDMGLDAKIKWVNDIFIGERKVCGILAQAGWKADYSGIDFVVVGIGINVYEPEGGFPEELQGIAGSLSLPRRAGTRDAIAAGILSRLDQYYGELDSASYMTSYREHSLLIGRAITVNKGEERIPALCLGIDEECHLLVRYEDGRKEALSSGEVSVRIR